jgi:hypothetical protein
VQRVLNFVIGIGPLGYDATINTTRGVCVIRSSRATNHDNCVGETWLDEKTVCVPFANRTVEFTLA